MEEKYRIKKQAYIKVIKTLYDVINQECFGGELPVIPVNIEKINNSYSFQSAAAFCHYANDKENISLIFDSRTAIFTDFYVFVGNVMDYLFHEMIHEYCFLNGIQDIDGEQHHNANFKETVEKFGMICWEKDKEYGFNHTIIPDNLLKKILDKIPSELWDYIADNIYKTRK